MNLLPDYKTIVDLIKKGATIEAQEMIMELRATAVELKEENIQLHEKLRELEGALSIANDLEWDGRVYWRQKSGSEKKDGPFCQVCYDVGRKLVRLQDSYIHSRGEPSTPGWLCMVCKGQVPKAGPC